ncbi:MAG: Ig-like domain-containing protein [Bacteroidales bacterium]|nr:Ig-like domain-containing protein [Bacteroidales bacterium]
MRIRLYIAGLILLGFQGCAKLGSPTGGIKDVYPPSFIGSTPANRSTGFNGDRIDITFDEYIKLKNQTKEIMISPPMEKPPLVRVREKTIRVSFEEELLPQTTYTLNFGNSLCDLNEENLLPDFEFIFATGDIIDSLSVTGKVVNAFDLKADQEAGIYIMLYESAADSAPLLEIPRYYGRANKDGLFAVNNIHPDTFRIAAIKDRNNNKRYDPGVEEMAFLDSLLVINAGNVVKQSFIKDTLKIITPADESLRAVRQNKPRFESDTIIAPGKTLNALNLSMYYFIEENEKVFLTNRERNRSEQITFTFSRPLYDSLKITPVNFGPVEGWYLEEFSKKMDTLTYWIRDTLISKKDTLVFKLDYLTTDSLGRLTEKTDTVTLRHQQVKGGSGRDASRRKPPKENDTPQKASLVLNSSVANRGTIDLNRHLYLTAPRPIEKINPDSAELLKKVDTLFVKQPFRCMADSLMHRKFYIESKWEPETQYRLLMKPNTARDIYGLSSDTIMLDFVSQRAEFYGRILLDFSCYTYPALVQVMDVKGSVIASRRAYEPGLITFDYLPPGNYSFKSIIDSNDNGIWDTGHYLKRIQPEKVYLSGKPESLRANWDWETAWSITR